MEKVLYSISIQKWTLVQHKVGYNRILDVMKQGRMCRSTWTAFRCRWVQAEYFHNMCILLKSLKAQGREAQQYNKKICGPQFSIIALWILSRVTRVNFYIFFLFFPLVLYSNILPFSLYLCEFVWNLFSTFFCI